MLITDKLFPRWSLKRALAASALDKVKGNNKRYYDGGKQGRWRSPVDPNSSPNALIQNGAAHVRQRVRDMDNNNDLVIGILDTLVNNVVGAGIQIQPQVKKADGSLAEKKNAEIAELWKWWCRHPDATRQIPFNELQRLMCRAWLRDGELIINQLRGKVEGLDQVGPVPYTLQVLESDFLPLELSEKAPYIIQGIEVDKFSKPLAYHIFKENPNDLWAGTYSSYVNVSNTQRIPADQIIHPKFTRRLNQLRGVSALHGILVRLDDLQEYADSERIAARVNAAFSAFIKRNPDTTIPNDTDDELADRQLEMSPGMIFDNLQPGEEVQSIGTNRPNPEFGNYVNTNLRAAAAGAGVNYATISRNYEGSYSSQRQSMMEAKVGYEKLSNYFIEKILQPIYAEFIGMAVAMGKITPHGVDTESLYDAFYSTPQTPWIDPKKEMEASILAVNNGLASKTEVIRSRGGDPETVARQLDQEQDTALNVQPPEPEPEAEPISEEEPEATEDE